MQSECIIATIVLLSAIFFSIATTLPVLRDDRGKKQFRDLLRPDQKERYATIVAERRHIFWMGVSFATIASVIVYLTFYWCSLNGASSLSWGVLAFFFVMHAYYILTPKRAGASITMLDTREQREAWQRVYRGMQVRNYGSMVAAVAIAVVVFGVVPCARR